MIKIFKHQGTKSKLAKPKGYIVHFSLSYSSWLQTDYTLNWFIASQFFLRKVTWWHNHTTNPSLARCFKPTEAQIEWLGFCRTFVKDRFEILFEATMKVLRFEIRGREKLQGMDLPDSGLLICASWTAVWVGGAGNWCENAGGWGGADGGEQMRVASLGWSELRISGFGKIVIFLGLKQIR